MDRKQIWAEIRALRANPPGQATNGPRRKVFGSALQQAEELFRSAEALGPTTRPINIFYGLSQATRALTAAGIVDKHAWQLRGHGITHEKGFDRDLSSVKFKESLEHRGAYTSLANLLNSTRSATPVLLVDALAALPHAPAGASWTTRVKPLFYGLRPRGVDNASFVISHDYFVETEGWPPPPEEAGENIEALRGWARDYLEANFPTLASGSPLPDDYPRLRAEGATRALTLKFRSSDALGSNWQRERAIQGLGTRYHSYSLAFPCFSGFTAPQHPLVIWWACLWCFSMYARYEPSRWASLTNVDTSQDAVGIETILEDSLDVVPEMVLRELNALK